MNLTSFFLTCLAVLSSIVAYFVLESYLFDEKRTLIHAVLILSTLKTVFFVSNVVRNELDFFDFSVPNPKLHAILVVAAISLIIFSYTADLTAIQYSMPRHFEGMEKNLPLWQIAFKLMFYSAHFFFWMGVVHIYPKSLSAEYITLLLSLTTFVTLAFSTIRFVTSKNIKI